MTLQKQLINLPITGGKSDDVYPLLNPGFARIVNMTMDKDGGLQKRKGYNKLSSLGSEAQDIFVFNDELLAVAGNTLYSYADSRDVWLSKGIISGIVGEVTPLVTAATNIAQSDYAELNGIGLTAYVDSGTGYLYADLIDLETGAKFVSRTTLSTATTYNPVVIPCGETLMVTWTESTNIKVARFSTSTPESGNLGTTTPITDLNATPYYDSCSFGSVVFIAYKQTAGNLKLALVSQNGILGNPLIGLPNPVLTSDSVDSPIAVCEGAYSDLMVCGKLAGNLQIQKFTNQLTTTASDKGDWGALSGTPLRFGVIVETTGSGYLVRGFYTSSAYVTYRFDVAMSSGTEGSILPMFYGSLLVSRPFKIGSNTNVLLGHYRSGTLQETFFLVDTTVGTGTANVISGKFLGSSAGVVPNGSLTRTNCQQVSGDYKIAVLNKARLGEDFISLYASSLISISAESVRSSVVAQDTLIISGGFGQRFDGNSVTELGFNLGPDALATSSTPSTGGSMSNGTYYYVAVYEWSDAKGNIEFSVPSPIHTVTLSGGGSSQRVILNVPTLAWTQKTDVKPVVALYRTVAGGTVFYKVSSTTSPTLNVLTADTVQITDSLADASLSGRQLLYTTGDIVENIAPPGFTSSVVVKQRLFVTGGECGDRIYFSKNFQPGTAPEFNDGFYITVGTKLTSLAELDDKLIAFSESLSYAISGDGPEATGINNTFSAPFRISSDVGCTAHDSISTIPSGLIFMSTKGIFLLDRGMNCSYIGSPAESVNDMTVVGSIVRSDSQDVLFNTEEGFTQRYDWGAQKWTTFESQPSLATELWQGSHVYLDTDGVVWVSQDDDYLDGGGSYKSVIETGWMQLAQINGFQRIWSILLLGKFIGEHKLVVRLRYDHSDIDREVLTITPSDVINGPNFGESSPYGTGSFGGEIGQDGVYRFQIRPAVQKCRAIKLIIEDAFEGDSSAGSFDLAGIGMVVGMKTGQGKMAAGRRLTGG